MVLLPSLAALLCFVAGLELPNHRPLVSVYTTKVRSLTTKGRNPPHQCVSEPTHKAVKVAQQRPMFLHISDVRAAG